MCIEIEPPQLLNVTITLHERLTTSNEGGWGGGTISDGLRRKEENKHFGCVPDSSVPI